MIGVVAQPAERETVREFFELFKTPWEFYREEQEYEVVVSTTEPPKNSHARLLILFRGETDGLREGNGAAPEGSDRNLVITVGLLKIPIYTTLTTFPTNDAMLLCEEKSGRAAAMLSEREGQRVIRVGFNLFAEVDFLLRKGQPPRNAPIPTLELHIAVLRSWILAAGITFVEIPPVPAGHPFIACLTHDIDHPLVRNHFCDHTMFGFLYRATFGSLLEALRGGRTFKELCLNWAAACRLPLVYLGLAEDFWGRFDRYLDIEAGQGATYFVIPRKDYAGRRLAGFAPAKRASRYELQELMGQLTQIRQAGCEIGVHGLDAWLDADEGRREQEQVQKYVDGEEAGIRMHWLYFDENSPAVLEEAGFSYDSTFGYNETVGFKAGTGQAFQLPDTRSLMELPLSVMDTALFYPAYLNLDQAAAERRVWDLLDYSERFGGSMTINWHDRSIAPERLWEDFYQKVLRELRRRRAWCPTAADAVGWFRKRRSATFEAGGKGDAVEVRMDVSALDNLPGLRLRVHKPRKNREDAGSLLQSGEFEDRVLNTENEVSIAI